VLPKDIRILAYSLVSPSFDARFSCIYRQYKYFFCKEQMDIELMNRAAGRLIGLHDFRNYCKKDDSLIKGPDDEQENFMRRIYKFSVELQHQSHSHPET
jgi:tRNA pseudouridine38/39 synthase